MLVYNFLAINRFHLGVLMEYKLLKNNSYLIPDIPRRLRPHNLPSVIVREKILNFQNRRSVRFTCSAIRAVWDDKPYTVLPNGKKAYLDEEDVVTFLDPPKQLIPLDPASYNPAAYLWKKIEDIPEDRRHRLASLLKPRLISRAWQIAGTRYEDANLSKKFTSTFLCVGDGDTKMEFYSCRSSGGPSPVAWMKSFKKAIFCCNGGKIYGRLIGGSIVAQFTNTTSPLYFMVKQHKEVMATEQPCDLAYDLGDGHLNLHDYPQGFPKPAKHPYPFNDQVVIYVRHIGPGVSIGQAWQEGKELQQVPRKLCGDILMVKD